VRLFKLSERRGSCRRIDLRGRRRKKIEVARRSAFEQRFQVGRQQRRRNGSDVGYGRKFRVGPKRNGVVSGGKSMVG
jgi:hypothetical protein